jgi:microcystin-dependent protein
MIKRTRKESGYSMLELSVALGIAAIIAVPATSTSTNTSENETMEYLASGNVFSDLENVTIFDPKVGDIIVFNGVEWVNQKLSLSFLGDMQVAIVPGLGDSIVFNDGKWTNQSLPAPALNTLQNVTLTSLAPGEALVWNGTEWVNGVSGIPGEIQMWTDTTEPEGWLVADGSEVSRTTYAALFATIGTTYGEGNGTTTFNLPDFRGKVAAGFDTAQTEFNALGKTGGAKTVTLTEAQMPSHTHVQNAHGHTGTAASGGAHGHTASTSTSTTHGHTGSAAADAGHAHNSRYDGSRGETTTRSPFKDANARQQNNAQWSGAAGDHGHTGSITSGGAHTHALTVQAAADHAHTVTINDATATNQNAGSGEGHPNLQPYIVVNYVIKY